MVAEEKIALDDILGKIERRLIDLAMRVHQGNKSGAAAMLSIWRPRLLRRLEQLGMESSKGNDEKDEAS